MKSFIAITTLVLSAQAFAFLPSISNSDFEATSRKANAVAKSAAASYADSRAEELVAFAKIGSKGLNTKYAAKTDTGCNFEVNVGLFFKATVTPKANCL